MSEAQYLNFPVTLMQGAFDNIHGVMNSILNYSGYVHTLTLDQGTNRQKMISAGNFIGIPYNDPSQSYDEGYRLYKDHPANSPRAGISKEVVLDYLNTAKTDFEIAVLCAHVALKSIIGNKPYIKTTNRYLVARMGGYARVDDIPDPVPVQLLKYSTRRFLDKIKFELKTNWGVNFYGLYVTGFYVSFDQKFTLDQLVYEAEARRRKNIEAKQKNAVDEARRKALEKLNLPV